MPHTDSALTLLLNAIFARPETARLHKTLLADHLLDRHAAGAPITAATLLAAMEHLTPELLHRILAIPGMRAQLLETHADRSHITTPAFPSRS